jgi:hypothetical protein
MADTKAEDDRAIAARIHEHILVDPTPVPGASAERAHAG